MTWEVERIVHLQANPYLHHIKGFSGSPRTCKVNGITKMFLKSAHWRTSLVIRPFHVTQWECSEDITVCPYVEWKSIWCYFSGLSLPAEKRPSLWKVNAVAAVVMVFHFEGAGYRATWPPVNLTCLFRDWQILLIDTENWRLYTALEKMKTPLQNFSVFIIYIYQTVTLLLGDFVPLLAKKFKQLGFI